MGKGVKGRGSYREVLFVDMQRVPTPSSIELTEHQALVCGTRNEVAVPNSGG